MNIIFIAFNENSLGRRIINLLLSEDIRPSHTFMASDLALKNFRKNGIRRYLRQNGIFNTLWRMYYRLTLRKELKTESLNNDPHLKTSIRDICRQNGIPFDTFDNINEKSFVDRLRELKPDLIVLGGAPLLKKEVLGLPAIGVLNSHPGWLPEAKGMDVVAHSILNRIPLGATVFKVDEGIDSGPVILKRALEQPINGRKLYEIESMVEVVSAQAMLDAVKMVLSGTYSFEPQEKRGTIFRSLNLSVYRRVKKLLNA